MTEDTSAMHQEDNSHRLQKKTRI
jgi:hypothetical protein